MTSAANLRETELFASFGDANLEAIASEGKTVELLKGEVLFAQGDDSRSMYVVERGRIAIVQDASGGREAVVALLEPGDLFGEMPLFDDGRRSAGARATEPSAVFSIPYSQLRKHYEQHPDELWGVVKLMVSRLRVADETLADSAYLDVTGRTAKRLLELAGDNEEFALPITQEELAGMVGASRERVNKAIATFVRLRWLKQAERRYTILERQKLANRAQ